ncbi:MAG: TIGR02453 family protein [Pseudomonadales bacterium]|nr:TIGR02453 family protein [Pseudomonadales bacterium]
MAQFKGYPKATFRYLKQLEKNNNRDWFGEHKSGYEQDVLEPSLDFIAAMQSHVHNISDHFDAIPKRMGGSLMRVYRDTRFSKDKTPYKTNIGIQFRHQLGKDVHAPGFYLHLDTTSCYVGIGLWRPDSKALQGIRASIVEQREEWHKIKRAKAFRDRFELGGASLKRAPKGFDPEDPDVLDLRRKDYVVTANLAPSVVTSDAFVKEVAATFRASSRFMEYLCKAVQVPF